ncbi:MAG TPA: L,D-transpeptidase [Longimicrobium sp.]|nr:L,D-transpeptidase [Longimicrobium sp.]
MRRFAGAALASAALLLGGCVVKDDADEQGAAPADGQVSQAPAAPAPAQPLPPPPPPPAPPPPDLRLEVNVAERELYVYRNDQRIATHPVAVGTKEWPTQTGEWTIGQVIWNPEWIPPEEEWAEKEEKKEAGAPDNPLGRAQLVYDAPRSIHGTNEPESLGKAASHGSIRVSNDVATRLARMVMEAGGATRDEAFYQSARANRKERVEVPIPNPVPIRVVAGGADDSSGSGSGSSSKGGGGR